MQNVAQLVERSSKTQHGFKDLAEAADQGKYLTHPILL